jgi:hypothetical protein
VSDDKGWWYGVVARCPSCVDKYSINMAKQFLIFVMVLFCQPVFADEDECDFDQKEQLKHNFELQKKYSGSHLADENRVVVIPVDEGEVWLGIGGCAHYGITVELKTKFRDRYRSEAALMRRVLGLAKAYSQAYIDHERLRAVIDAKKWNKETSPIRYYMLQYDDISTFEVYEDEDGSRTVIGLSYYN